MGHIRGTSRSARRGSASLTPLAKALAKFGFFAPLTEDVFLDKGYGAASFTRATTATVVDHEGCIRNCLSGEVRFHGQRRVRNACLCATTTWNGSTSNATLTTGISDPDGGTAAVTVTSTVSNGGTFTNAILAIPSGNKIVVSLWIRRRTGTGAVNLTAGGAAATNIASIITSSWQRVSAPFVSVGTVTLVQLTLATNGDAVDIYKVMSEDLTGSSNQNPSEYVSVGAAKLNELRETENLGTSPWILTNVTVSNGTTPEFAAAILKKVAATASAVTSLIQEHTATATSYCYTVYGKKDTGATDCNKFIVRNNTTPANLIAFTINWDTGAISHSIGSGATATDEGGGVWRITIPVSAGIVVGNTMRLYAGFDSSAETANEAAYLGGAQAVPDTTTASTYFPVGNVYPYHGACVDGVKYFDTLNGNTVASNVVTEATGAAITRPENDGLTNGLVLGGQSSGNNATTPDSAALSITGDMEIEMDFHKPSINGYIASKSSDSCATHGWELLFSSTPKLYLKWFDGTATRSASPVAAWPYSTTTRGQAKVVLDVDNGAGGCAVSYYYRPDSNAAWTLLETVTQAFTTAIVDSAVALAVGSNPAGATGHGEYYRCIIRNGIDGTTVFDADFTAQELGATSFTESSSNAATVTVNRSGAVPAYIGNPLRLFNYEGYLAESARTNLVLQSSNFGTTWSAAGTPTRSAAAAYCGEVALDLIGDDAAGALEYYDQPLLYTGNAAKSVSFLVKQGTSTSTVVRANDTSAPADRLLMAITWSNGIPVCTYTTGSAERASEYMGGGVWRIFCLTTSITAANLNYLKFYPATDAALAVTGTGDIYIGGVQAENATTASASHIPTTTATVTFNKDELDFPATGNATTTATSLYAESFLSGWPGGNPSLATVRNATERNAQLFWFSATAVNGYAYAGTYNDATSAGSPTARTLVKAATAVAANDGMKAVNGTLGTADATVTVSGSAVTTIDIGKYSTGSQLNGVVRNIRVATTRVPDADLRLITQ